MGQRIAYEMPVVLTRAQLGAVVDMRGHVLLDPIIVQGMPVHEGGTLVLLGFAGKASPDGVCTGHYQFRRVQPQDEEREQFVLSELPMAQEACHGVC
jgi:hypothetical protein